MTTSYVCKVACLRNVEKLHSAQASIGQTTQPWEYMLVHPGTIKQMHSASGFIARSTRPDLKDLQSRERNRQFLHYKGYMHSYTILISVKIGKSKLLNVCSREIWQIKPKCLQVRQMQASQHVYEFYSQKSSNMQSLELS